MDPMSLPVARGLASPVEVDDRPVRSDFLQGARQPSNVSFNHAGCVEGCHTRREARETISGQTGVLLCYTSWWQGLLNENMRMKERGGANREPGGETEFLWGSRPIQCSRDQLWSSSPFVHM